MTQPSPHNWTIPEINTLTALWQEGIRLDDIQSRMGLSRHVIWRMRKKLELPYRNAKKSTKKTVTYNPDPLLISLRLLRERLNLARVDVAAILGYDHCTLSDWERGRYSPRLFQLRAWAEALNVTLTVSLESSNVRTPNQEVYSEKEARSGLRPGDDGGPHPRLSGDDPSLNPHLPRRRSLPTTSPNASRRNASRET
jgi:transcriptional regulator with XRE-family HTH domain